MTANQKRRITLMRQNHVGYAAIANELKLPLSTVKAFCRRNGLQASDLASDTQPENIAEASPDIDLISAGSRGNSTTATKPESLAKPSFSDDQPICEVTITYADEPDEAAVADVLDMLRSANYRR